MNKNRKIGIIALLIGVVVIGMVLIRPAPQSILWESYYTQTTFTFSIEPEKINNRWVITETKNTNITLNIIAEAKNPFNQAHEYVTEVVVTVEPFNRNTKEVARYSPADSSVRFRMEAKFPNENGYFRIRVRIATTNHPTLETNTLEFLMKGLYYPYVDILDGEWVAVGALDTGVDDTTTTTDENGNGDNGDNGDNGLDLSAPFIPITFLIGTLILLAKKRKREVKNA